jgi:hypothetical protein
MFTVPVLYCTSSYTAFPFIGTNIKSIQAVLKLFRGFFFFFFFTDLVECFSGAVLYSFPVLGDSKLIMNDKARNNM